MRHIDGDGTQAMSRPRSAQDPQARCLDRTRGLCCARRPLLGQLPPNGLARADACRLVLDVDRECHLRNTLGQNLSGPFRPGLTIKGGI